MEVHAQRKISGEQSNNGVFVSQEVWFMVDLKTRLEAFKPRLSGEFGDHQIFARGKTIRG